MEEHRAAALEAGCNEYLVKPVNAGVLLERVEHLTGENP
jgi:DNA-binding response OmpR family regulator